jgi:hypothetical protein
VQKECGRPDNSTHRKLRTPDGKKEQKNPCRKVSRPPGCLGGEDIAIVILRVVWRRMLRGLSAFLHPEDGDESSETPVTTYKPTWLHSLAYQRPTVAKQYFSSHYIHFTRANYLQRAPNHPLTHITLHVKMAACLLEDTD